MSVSILVVDDEPDVALLFRQQFRREVRDGTYVMHIANSGEMALEQLNGGIEPTLIVILSDINMPGMDGLRLLEAIKKRFPDMPVMMVTAYGVTSAGGEPANLALSSSSPSRSTSTG
jgi:CheY-like chemotaxis protein